MYNHTWKTFLQDCELCIIVPKHYCVDLERSVPIFSNRIVDLALMEIIREY